MPISGITVRGLVRLRAADTMPLWYTGGDFGVEASILTTFSLALLAAFFLAILARRRSRTPGAWT
jgi:hypothetical protein